MTQVETVPHECEGNIVFTEHGLSPYWILSKHLTVGFDGFSGEIEVPIDGESWALELSNQKSGIAPWLTDPVGGDRLYEFRISARGIRIRLLLSVIRYRRFELPSSSGERRSDGRFHDIRVVVIADFRPLTDSPYRIVPLVGK